MVFKVEHLESFGKWRCLFAGQESLGEMTFGQSKGSCVLWINRYLQQETLKKISDV